MATVAVVVAVVEEAEVGVVEAEGVAAEAAEVEKAAEVGGEAAVGVAAEAGVAAVAGDSGDRRTRRDDLPASDCQGSTRQRS